MRTTHGKNPGKTTGGSGWRPPCAARSGAPMATTRPVSRQPKAAPSQASSSQQQQQLPSTATITSSSRLKPEVSLNGPASLPLDEDQSTKQNITVTVRFRPLSPLEIRQGEEVAWYADGDKVVQSEENPDMGYAYDRVFAPTTTTRKVYDVTAKHVVSGAMEGIYGTVIAYGVTSSGKTHTMHGCQRSPGIIPLAVKDAFSIIQETPNREFLLRVSYLEIYNEVVHDLLNPGGKNLRIRNDARGTSVEGIKEEEVVSPSHALSLIAAGEVHRHVGFGNFNIRSSRSHTIFTMTIESTSCGESNEGDTVNFSQLHLIDLAGAVSSRAETTGVLLTERSYINGSLLNLGTVISNLTEGTTHIPFQNSKLTRLLQSSLSGKGHVSLICTVTPAASNSKDTHDTLKFAHLAKRIEVQASQNKIIGEKSLIKKYQNEILRLKEELEVEPRLEKEEEAKSALLARIEHLTKLVLVSSKATQSSGFSPNPGRRRHSFGEEELAYLPHSSRDLMLDNGSNELLAPVDVTRNITSKPEKKNQKGLLNLFKIRKRDGEATTLTSSDCDKSSLTKSTAPSTPIGESLNFSAEQRISNSLVNGDVSADMLSISHGEFPSDLPGEEETPLSYAEPLEELNKESIELESSGVNLEAQQHCDEEKIVPTEISPEQLQNKQQVSCLINRLERLMRDMKKKMTSLEKRIDKLDLLPSCAETLEEPNEKSIELEKSSGVNHEAEQHSDQEKTVPSEISPKQLQHEQQVSRLIYQLERQLRDMKQKMRTLEEQLVHSLSGSQVKV